MGVTHVTVAIRNPAEPEGVWEGLFLVDTGATDCLVPRQHLESIGLKDNAYTDLLTDVAWGGGWETTGATSEWTSRSRE